MSASTIVSYTWVHWIARFFLVSSRTVNSLVWALLFVSIFGSDVISGVIAIAFRSIGFIGKLLGEALDELNIGSVEALKATGAPKITILMKAYWPEVMPAFFSILLFRWDINVRESAVLGLVSAGGIGVVLSDLDDTLTWEGKMHQEIYISLGSLKKNGKKIVVVTGACAGWCDCIIRTWPIDCIIGENGAFWLFLDEKGNLIKEYQLLDIAFDINQEVKIDKDIVIKASNWLKEKGLNVSVSSIHINAWFGDYNKVTTSLSWFKKYDIKKEKCSFIGDSCNDEPMFEAFEETAGVANITKVLDSLTHKPKYITHNNGGFGFVEFANSLI